MKSRQKVVRRWMAAAVAAGTLLGGAAYALSKDCWRCWPCGCAEDGGYVMCCENYACQQ
ncbi:hypothetical protein JRI60_04865 [Archangium violaceum]|uniref:hypothetical protein n=1 Tax=Archangium violaceum TaxID=83451 RepID=UPI0019527D78|nr:hypothetical protein [Archangium violaceum]QRN98395.1 hypothetical protein JRI60_04865 [Archangium violaceum]